MVAVVLMLMKVPCLLAPDQLTVDQPPSSSAATSSAPLMMAVVVAAVAAGMMLAAATVVMTVSKLGLSGLASPVDGLNSSCWVVVEEAVAQALLLHNLDWQKHWV